MRCITSIVDSRELVEVFGRRACGRLVPILIVTFRLQCLHVMAEILFAVNV
jgi:hypothetical protein